MALFTFSIITLIIYIIIFIILYKILKSIFKTIISIILISIVILGVLGFLVYLDFNDLKTNFPNSKNMILFENKDVVAGIIIDKNQEIILLKQQDIDNIKTKDKKSILKDQNLFKIVYFNINTIKESNLKTINLGSSTLTKEQVITILESEDAFTETKAQLNLPVNIKNMPFDFNDKKITLEDQAQLKAILFASTLKEILSQNTSYIIEEYNKNNIQIYKETILFKILKLLPTDTINNIVNKNIYK